MKSEKKFMHSQIRKAMRYAAASGQHTRLSPGISWQAKIPKWLNIKASNSRIPESNSGLYGNNLDLLRHMFLFLLQR